MPIWQGAGTAKYAKYANPNLLWGKGLDSLRNSRISRFKNFWARISGNGLDSMRKQWHVGW